jgi:GTP-binding protein HflX
MKELHIDDRPVIMVFNKIDLVEDKSRLREIKEEFEGSILISAQRGLFIEDLRQEIIKFATEHSITTHIKVNLSEQKLLASIYEWARVLNREYEDGYVQLQIRFPSTMERKFAQLVEEGAVVIN